MGHDARRNNDKTRKAEKKSGFLKSPEFFQLSVPRTEDQKPSICSSCPFLHWRLQGLGGLCCKWSQNGLSFILGHTDSERVRAHERGTMKSTLTAVLSLVWTHTGLIAARYAKYTCPDLLKTQQNTQGYKVMASSCVRVAYSILQNSA